MHSAGNMLLFILSMHKLTFSPFRRQRTTPPGTSSWVVLLEGLNSTISSLQVEVLNTRSQARLQLQLIALADSTLHLQLDEMSPLRPRYRAKESLNPSEPSLSKYFIL